MSKNVKLMSDDVQLYPQTLTSLVADTSGNTLDDILADYVTASDVEAYGYQTEDEVNALITAALEEVENGSY